jgi:hypothetical protein
MIPRPSPLGRNLEILRPSARCHWRCTSIVAGPTSTSSSGKLDQTRVAYLRYLRRELKRSPRTEADDAMAGRRNSFDYGD